MEYKTFYKYIEYDGIRFFTMVLLPGNESKYPTVIYRNPYVDEEADITEDELCKNKLDEFSAWLDGGYAVVYQHCRGRGRTTGDCIPYIHEREDGLFLHEWIRRQDFYNGELYLCGASYLSSVHYVTAPFAPDIKGAVLEAQDCERYNLNYRNGFFKVGLHGSWFVGMYKAMSGLKKSYTVDSYRMLPLSDFSKTVFGEPCEALDEVLKHPKKDDPFWNTRLGGGEAKNAIYGARIPILLVTGFYDIYTGGVFDMWHGLDRETRDMCALAVHPFDHGGSGDDQPVSFENGNLSTAFKGYGVRWFDSIRGKCESPFEKGKITYYKTFDNKWCCDSFYDANTSERITLGKGQVSYKYNPFAPADFKGGLSANFGGNAWQDKPNSRCDIISLYTPEFEEDTYVKGKMTARLAVKSDCDDTCFYMRISLCKAEGDYGLRDDINQISNFDASYLPGGEIGMDFAFDEHAFVIRKGEKLRIDISSSAWPHYIPHTNMRGLFFDQKSARVANNTVILDKSFINIPILK